MTCDSISIDSAGATMKFLGGSFSTAAQLNQGNNGSYNYIFGGFDADDNFCAAAAKSVNSTNRLQMKSGSYATYNVAASNLLSSTVAGLDDNALFYTTGEFQQMQSQFLFDFTNITLESLAASGISDSGTYYVALASWGVTYKAVGGSEFNPVLLSSEDTDLVAFEGFEWGNGTNQQNNTLYAVLSVNVPEPSTYAAIFGALALAFVAYRRRK